METKAKKVMSDRFGGFITGQSSVVCVKNGHVKVGVMLSMCVS